MNFKLQWEDIEFKPGLHPLGLEKTKIDRLEAFINRQIAFIKPRAFSYKIALVRVFFIYTKQVRTSVKLG